MKSLAEKYIRKKSSTHRNRYNKYFKRCKYYTYYVPSIVSTASITLTMY